MAGPPLARPQLATGASGCHPAHQMAGWQQVRLSCCSRASPLRATLPPRHPPALPTAGAVGMPPRPPASTAPVVRSSGPTAGKQGRVQAGSAPEWRASPGMFALFPALMPTSPHPPGQKAPRQFQTAIRLPKGSGGLRFMTAVGLGNCMACRLEHEARVEGGNPAALAGQAECSCFSGSEPPSPATTLRPPRTRARADHLGSAPQPSDPPSSSRRRSARSIR